LCALLLSLVSLLLVLATMPLSLYMCIKVKGTVHVISSNPSFKGTIDVISTEKSKFINIHEICF